MSTSSKGVQQKSHKWMADAVWWIHVAFVILNVIIPFTNNVEWLKLHALMLPFLFVHWVSNNDTCALTLLECCLRGVRPKHSFFHHMVSPIYKLHQDQVQVGIWVASYALWALTMHKLYGL